MNIFLNQCEINKNVIVTKFCCDDSVTMQLIIRGISIDTKLSIVAKRKDGAAIIAIGDVKIALDKFITKQLMVRNVA